VPKPAPKARWNLRIDIWIQRRRWGQVLRPFRQQYGPLEAGSNPHRGMAQSWPGKIAGEEYERLLRCATRQYYRGMKLGVKGSVEILFGRLEEDGHISLEDKSLLRRIWETRKRLRPPRQQPQQRGSRGHDRYHRASLPEVGPEPIAQAPVGVAHSRQAAAPHLCRGFLPRIPAYEPTA